MDTQKGNGTVISIAIIVVILILGAIYMWSAGRAKVDMEEIQVENMMASPEELEQEQAKLEEQNTSDEFNSIESDLESTSFSEF